MGFARLRRVLVVVPVVAIVLVDYARRELPLGALDGWVGSAIVVALVFLGSTLLTRGVFALFERRRQSLLRLAEGLAELGAVTRGGRRAQPDILAAALDRSLAALPAEAGAIYLLGPAEPRLHLAAVRTRAGGPPSLAEEVDAAAPPFGEALRGGDVTLQPSAALGCLCAGPAGSVALVPLRSRDVVLGLLVVTTTRPAALRENLDLLALLGWQIGVTIDNLRLFEETRQLLEQSRSVAVLEERDRLARELHDSLAQVLGLVGIKARVIEELIQRREYGRAAAEAADVATTADAAYSDVREAILGLRRSTTSPGLIDGLRDYLERFGRQSGLRVRLEVHPEANTRLAPAAETQLIRVVQEALANVRKHARARGAVVRFEPEAGWVRIVVEDDGQGFDAARPAPSPGQGFGLQIMRERIEEVEGTLEVDSSPGHGTRITARLPAPAAPGWPGELVASASGTWPPPR